MCLDVSTGGTGGVSSWLQAAVQLGSLCVAILTEHKRCSLQNTCNVLRLETVELFIAMDMKPHIVKGNA
jgi:hypothetical protein